MKYSILVFLLFVGFLDAETKVLEDKIVFTAQHKFKTIKGKVQKANYSNIVISRAANRYFAQPFSIQVNLVDMRTGDPNRDTHMMEVLGYPTQDSVQLNILKMEETSSAKEYKIFIEAKINGVTKSLHSIATANEKDGNLSVKGQIKILLDEFQIKAPSLLFFPIDNIIICDYEILLSI
jgi:hypothetical protein